MSKHIEYLKQNRAFIKMGAIADEIGFNRSDFSLLINGLKRISNSKYRGGNRAYTYDIVLPTECQRKLELFFDRMNIVI